MNLKWILEDFDCSQQAKLSHFWVTVTIFWVIVNIFKDIKHITILLLCGLMIVHYIIIVAQYIMHFILITNTIFSSRGIMINQSINSKWNRSSKNLWTLKLFYCSLSLHKHWLECGATLHLKMPRNRKRECPAWKQVRSDMIKSHCKTKHGISDDQINGVKTYLCK